mmetsp:Transcript_34411/g.78444  ORF Transcript_34411/g.78444 Transcript_34411/m.78444 type:complete len:806 (-) Transcript_34411:67-2484(-)
MALEEQRPRPSSGAPAQSMLRARREVIIAFHPSLAVPPAAKSLDGAAITIEAPWTVRQLGEAVEARCADIGVGLRVVALLCPERATTVPLHEPAVSYFAEGGRVLVIGDFADRPWPKAVIQADQGSKTTADPVPIVIFTGFLGSGKTTVLNHLLKEQRDKKFAVIENEFGEVPIDNELLQNSAMGMAEQVVVMENGCMCCTVRGDLLGAFDAIRRQMETGNRLDAVLVETTGMADPVPIVRTIRTTPDIARHFRMDGTITLVDAKTVLDRLGEFAGRDDQERHRQIAFADKILLSKTDLVDVNQVAEVYHRIRSYNSSTPVIASFRGVIPPAELTNLGAFDMDKIEFEEAAHEEGHGDGHGGGHDHGDGHECHEDHGHGGGHEVQAAHGAAHGHGHSSRHDTDIGSFSIVRRGVEVDRLAFARWVRIIATLPEEQGILYRSKAVLAVAGSAKKLIFHAVADVTETSEGLEWGDDEERVCKMVFIGKKLAKKEISERYLQLLQPARPSLRSFPCPAEAAPRNSLQHLIAGMLHRVLICCWTKDVLRVSQASAYMHDLLLGPRAHSYFTASSSSVRQGDPVGMHTKEGDLWLHGLMPVRSIKNYALAWRDGRIIMNMPSSVKYLYGEPLMYHSASEAEAAAVMWLEVAEMKDAGTVNMVVEFRWRPEIMQSFFDNAGSATNSALVKVEVEDPSGDADLDDELKFRINLNPEESKDLPGLAQHRMSIQLVGGKSSNYVYAIFFHTIDPTYQVHINVPDHRQPIFPTQEVFHKWHPLMAALKRQPKLRFLLRLRPSTFGPLDAMCGCCG